MTTTTPRSTRASALRRHVTFANTCSLLALLVATGTGTAYAANTVRSRDIVNGQVRTVDLAGNAVTSPKLKNGSVTLDDLADGSVAGPELVDGSVTEDELAANSVGPAEVQAGAIDGDGVVDNSLSASDLAPGSVAGSEVLNDSLTFADLASGSANGSISLPAGDVANGTCEQKAVGIGGAAVGDAIVFSVRGPVQSGVFFYGTEVISAGVARFQACNLSGGAMAAVTNLPVRILTFH